MTKKKILAVVVIALVLIVIGLVVVSMTSHKTARSTPPRPSVSASSTPSQETEDPTTDSPATTDPDATKEATAPPVQTPVVPGTTLRSVHSPGIVTKDIDLTAGQCHVRTVDAKTGKYLPDASCTPGAVDPAVTQDNIVSTICKSGYTSTIRPSASKTNVFKKRSLSEYNVAPQSTVEYDHLISLQLGGANAVSNLWVEPNKDEAKGTTNPKDAVETKLKTAVCKGTIPLAKAQQAIATDWTTAEQVLGL